jgi:hypothetical protein
MCSCFLLFCSNFFAPLCKVAPCLLGLFMWHIPEGPHWTSLSVQGFPWSAHTSIAGFVTLHFRCFHAYFPSLHTNHDSRIVETLQCVHSSGSLYSIWYVIMCSIKGMRGEGRLHNSVGNKSIEVRILGFGLQPWCLLCLWPWGVIELHFSPSPSELLFDSSVYQTHSANMTTPVF